MRLRCLPRLAPFAKPVGTRWCPSAFRVAMGSPKLCSRKGTKGELVICFVAGIIGRFLSPGPNRPNGFILTTGLGIAGAFVATFIGQTIGWYRLDQGAGLIGATVGALLVLFIWNRLVARRLISDPGTPSPGPSTPPRRQESNYEQHYRQDSRESLT